MIVIFKSIFLLGAPLRLIPYLVDHPQLFTIRIIYSGCQVAIFPVNTIPILIEVGNFMILAIILINPLVTINPLKSIPGLRKQMDYIIMVIILPKQALGKIPCCTRPK